MTPKSSTNSHQVKTRNRDATHPSYDKLKQLIGSAPTRWLFGKPQGDSGLTYGRIKVQDLLQNDGLELLQINEGEAANDLQLLLKTRGAVTSLGGGAPWNSERFATAGPALPWQQSRYEETYLVIEEVLQGKLQGFDEIKFINKVEELLTELNAKLPQPKFMDDLGLDDDLVKEIDGSHNVWSHIRSRRLPIFEEISSFRDN
ncbi:hypothetical protein KIW84_024330 [Lathyrus oleraceus]|uniref:Uncharacterized protein n=1 Tax=Pisum sativum TaxID=3888 RepID=A0A9D4YFB6_PEA|nr:hypothetical protein KIW84_024330 [Pisum sativum]